MHYIREKVIYDLVLENMRRVFYLVTTYEKEFAMFQLDAFTAQREKELILKKQELEKSKNVSKKLIHLYRSYMKIMRIVRFPTTDLPHFQYHLK